jgi:hypothetical protein
MSLKRPICAVGWPHSQRIGIAPKWRLTSFYPLTSVFRKMGLPLREGLMGDNGLPWLAAVQRPEFFLTQEWPSWERGDSDAERDQPPGAFRVTYRQRKR